MIRDYFQLRSPKHASFIIQKIFEVTKTLETFPKIGRVVPELSIENIREILYREYRIIYWYDEGSTADILTVFHSSRQFGKLPET